MWVLESSSELFQGRRMWLKPGKSYLFGRVKKDGVRFAIEHKTISRKHFIIKVEDVNIEDVGNIHARTKLTIEDQNSKAGTTVNGEHIKGISKDLKKEENYVKPGSLPQDLVIKWHPVVLTYNLLKKEIKAGVLKTKQERLRDLDIKVVSEYIPGQTTHLVVNKRNTPKSLQALIDGRPLVAESYIDSLEYATTPSDLNEEENLSPLEQDFDSAWPEPFDHLPAPGREPTTRPAETYKPDSKRKHVFENFTFVFLDQNQYDNLLPPIVTGHGKALLCKIAANETTVDEVVTYLHNAAGSKGFGDDQSGSGKGGVILVRYKGDAGAEDWTNRLVNETSLRLDQRAIDQGEFLDAVLANDAALLRQAVPFENQPDNMTAHATSYNPSQSHRQDGSGPTTPDDTSPSESTSAIAGGQADPSSQELNGDHRNGHQNGGLHMETAATQGTNYSNGGLPAVKRLAFSVPKKSRVFDFDDDFDPGAVTQYHGDDNHDDDTSVYTSTDQQRMSTPPSDGGPNGVKDEPMSSKKRSRSTLRQQVVNNSDDSDMADLLPAAAAMKRRKLAHEGREDTPIESSKGKLLPALSKKPKGDKVLDVRKIARAQRQAEDDRIKKEEDDLEEELRIEPGQPLPIYDVETILIDLPTRERSSNEVTEVSSDRWDPKWNGRKNFKGFRRAKDAHHSNGDTAPLGRYHNKVIVPLVDGKVSTYGMGDQYWDKTAEEKERERLKKRKASQRTTQSQSDANSSLRNQRSNTVVDSDDEDDADASDAHGTRTSPQMSRLQHEAEEIMNHAVDVDEPRRTRGMQTQTSAGQSIPARKRPASSVGSTTNTKKQKQLPITVVRGDDSDDSDDMKFRFGSRRRGKGKT